MEFATQTDLSSANTGWLNSHAFLLTDVSKKILRQFGPYYREDLNDKLYHSLQEKPDNLSETGIKTIKCIGDCLAPSTIAAAVYSGHLAARELETGHQKEEVLFKSV